MIFFDLISLVIFLYNLTRDKIKCCLLDNTKCFFSFTLCYKRVCSVWYHTPYNTTPHIVIINLWKKIASKFLKYFCSSRTSLALEKEVGCLVHCVSVIKYYCNCVLQHQISQMTIQTRYQKDIWNSRDLKMLNFCYLIDTNNETSPATVLCCYPISYKVKPHFKNWRSVSLFSLIE